MDPAPAVAAQATVPSGLPDTGTLTFLFTDVEGSTPLWERHEATMRDVTARHDALLDGIIAAHGGTRVRERGEGDSIFAVFTEPMAAVVTALTMVRVVMAEPWPEETPIRVRMGLHSGAAQLRAGDYYGPVVNRCARIRGLGHGGQVLLSGPTAALVRNALPEGASLRSLGAHTLRGHAEPEEVFQLCHPDLPAEFPPLLSPQAPRHNLPQALTALVGREVEQGEVLALLAEARLVTLTGSGGVGKTRLALAVASELVDRYADGVWLVELAPLADASLVPGAVALVLGVREEAGRPPTATLTEYLREKRLLLVLDNCEHLVTACAPLVSSLLRACPDVRILATSREGLEVAGERRWRVPSLSVPDLRHLPPPDLAASYEAVRLFVARARERRADFALTAQNVRSIAQVCARLDGIPLAVELAAARVASLGVEGIVVRLDDRFRLLTGGGRDVLPRQRTLRAALDWSYDLLTAPEQALLDRLSVFGGGCTFAAVEAVCAGEGVVEWEVLDLLGGLVGKSLLQAEERDEGVVRYGLLETVRHYGWERLAAAGAAEAVRDRHLAWYLALAEEAEPHLKGPEQLTWLDRLEGEHDNLRAALGWARERGSGEMGLRLAAALARFWWTRGYFGEGRSWLEGALAGGEGVALAIRAQAASGAGSLVSKQGEYGRAAALHEEALALRRVVGDTQGIAFSLGNLADMVMRLGEYGRATSLHEEALALWRGLDNRRGLAITLNGLGNLVHNQGEYRRAAAMYAEALALFRGLGDWRSSAIVLTNLGHTEGQQGQYGRAAALHEEALALFRELGDWRSSAMALTNLGNVARRQGQYGRAAALHEESLRLSRAVGTKDDILADALENLAWVASACGQPGRAARLGGAAEAMRETLGQALTPIKLTDHDRAVQTMRAALGEEGCIGAWAAGRALSPDEAVALALEDSTATEQG